MRKAAIVIEPWKLDIFKKHLLRHEFVFTVQEGIIETVPTVTIFVTYAPWIYSIEALKQAVTDAQRESWKSKPLYDLPAETSTKH